MRLLALHVLDCPDHELFAVDRVDVDDESGVSPEGLGDLGLLAVTNTVDVHPHGVTVVVGSVGRDHDDPDLHVHVGVDLAAHLQARVVHSALDPLQRNGLRRGDVRGVVALEGLVGGNLGFAVERVARRRSSSAD